MDLRTKFKITYEKGQKSKFSITESKRLKQNTDLEIIERVIGIHNNHLKCVKFMLNILHKIISVEVQVEGFSYEIISKIYRAQFDFCLC